MQPLYYIHRFGQFILWQRPQGVLAFLLKSRGVSNWYVGLEMKCPEIYELIGAAEARSTVPIVRLPDNSLPQSKNIGSGAAGIFIPGIAPERKLVEVVKATKYAPVGIKRRLSMGTS